MGILVVDDDEDIRETVEEVLRAEGYKTKGVSNGEEARRVLERGGERPELILLDLMMPVMDGWDFLYWLDESAELRHIPVAIMSAHPSIQRAFEIAQARKGAAHLRLHGGNPSASAEPLDPSQLLSAVRETCPGEPALPR